jgi:PDZ domain
VQNDSCFNPRIAGTVELRKARYSTPRKLCWVAAALSLMAGPVADTYAQSTPLIPVGPSNVQTVVFKGSTSSSGWIDFTPLTNFGIYLPAKINGHDAMALLYGGPSNIDKNFVESIGLAAKKEDASSVNGIQIQLGDLILQNADAKTDDLQKQGYDAKILGQPVLFRLGEEVFNQLAVDIDYAHHRVAFHDPRTVAKPAGAIEVPLIELDGERVLPLSIDGATPEQFELELGNVIGPLMVTPAYATRQKLIEGRPTSQRLSGRYSETVVSVDHLSFAGVDFAQVPIALIPDTELPPPSITGGVGLPLLAEFRLIIDYPHNRLYAMPNSGTTMSSIEKDRIGLVLDKKVTNGFSVAFVSPNSPAEAAGFKEGDKISLIDGKPFEAWPTQAIIKFQMADAGTIHIFTMADGTVRRIKAVDFF